MNLLPEISPKEETKEISKEVDGFIDHVARILADEFVAIMKEKEGEEGSK